MVARRSHNPSEGDSLWRWLCHFCGASEEGDLCEKRVPRGGWAGDEVVRNGASPSRLEVEAELRLFFYYARLRCLVCAGTAKWNTGPAAAMTVLNAVSLFAVRRALAF